MVVARDAWRKEAQKRMDNQPSWLKRAMNPNTPITDGNETVRTIDFEIDGVLYIAPTLRMGKDGLKRFTRKEAEDEAIRRGDAMRVPDGMTGTEFSNFVSDTINDARKHRGRQAGSSAEKAR